jgi:hypothetical protein
MSTIQSIELGRLTLSERFAYAIGQEIGIRAKWLLANELPDPPPDPEKLRQRFKKAQTGRWRGNLYGTHLLPRALLFRTYVLYREVTYELGYSGFETAGGKKLLEKFTGDLLELIPDGRLQRSIYQKVRETWLDSEKTYSLALTDLQELERHRQERQKEAEKNELRFRKTPPEVSPAS